MAKTFERALDAEVIAVSKTAYCLKIVTRTGVVAAMGLLLANCSTQQQYGYSSQQQREFGAFASRKYGTASPRMYADTGAAMPKGGGRDHIGKSYSVAGRRYTPHDRPVGSSQVGMASWYGAAFHGRKTANGEIYDRRSFSAAHPTMPLPSYARVTNLRNGASIIVRVNDRGPYHGGRIMDVSERVADSLAFKGQGTGRIRVDYLGRAGLGGSDDVRLAQTLSTNGAPAVAAHIPASYGENRSASQPVQVASAAAVPVASAAPAEAVAFSPRQTVTTSPVAAVQPPVAPPAPVANAKADVTGSATAKAAPAAPAAGESTGRSAAVAAAAAIAQKNEAKGAQAKSAQAKGTQEKGAQAKDAKAKNTDELPSARAPQPPGRPVNLGRNAQEKAGSDKLSQAPRFVSPLAEKGRAAAKKAATLAQLD